MEPLTNAAKVDKNRLRGKKIEMRLPKFEYLEPRNLKEAAKVLAADAKGSALLAGGTDLLVNMKHWVIQPKQQKVLEALHGKEKN